MGWVCFAPRPALEALDALDALEDWGRGSSS
jgi:hypothetical protein